MKSNQEIDKKILVSGKVMDSVFTEEIQAKEKDLSQRFQGYDFQPSKIR